MLARLQPPLARLRDAGVQAPPRCAFVSRRGEFLALCDAALCGAKPLDEALLSHELFELGPAVAVRARALRLALELAAALVFVHDRGVLHQAVSPKSCALLRTASGDVRLQLGNFELARFLKVRGGGARARSRSRALPLCVVGLG